jgi:hypothetical protein
MPIRHSLGELDLSHQLGLEPYALFHLLLSQSPLDPFLLGQVGKGASTGLQILQPVPYLTAKARHKAIPHLGDVKQVSVLVVPDYLTHREDFPACIRQ